MKKYNRPEIEIKSFASESVMATSLIYGTGAGEQAADVIKTFKYTDIFPG